MNVHEGDNVTLFLVPEDGDPVEFATNEQTNKIGDAPFETLLDVGNYSICLRFNAKDSKEVFINYALDKEFKLGANYQILVQYDGVKDDPLTVNVLTHQITSENEIHIFWLLPQFVIMTAGEIMFSITSLQFSFTQVSFEKI